MLARSTQALLANLIDYAGMFPPASLSLEEAVRKYQEYQRGPYAWMLGRFVVPADRAREVPSSIPLSVLGDAPWEIIETKEIVQPNGRTVYVEGVPVSELAKSGLRAKIRTGGVTPEAFPSAERVAQFIRECRDHHVPFKATAGLHHPLRCVKPLTYKPDAPVGTMHGFINVFIAAAIPDRAEDVLLDNDFELSANGVRWRDVQLTREDIAYMRTWAISFGSCSFEEPISDLQELGWL
jgi:hypothetical protein